MYYVCDTKNKHAELFDELKYLYTFISDSRMRVPFVTNLLDYLVRYLRPGGDFYRPFFPLDLRFSLRVPAALAII